MAFNIVYIHPAIRIYRLAIFKQLSQKLNVNFFWSEKPKKKSRISFEVDHILKHTDISYTQAKPWQKLPVNGLSWDLLKLPFKSYHIYIFSNITSAPYLFLSPILRILGKKIIVFDELWRYPKEVKKYQIIYPYIKFLSRYCLDSAVLSGSKARDFYCNKLDVNRDKTFIAYNTTIDTKKHIQDQAQNNKVFQQLQTIRPQKIILYLGRIVPYKGLDVLIQAMVEISHNYDLVIVGDGEFKIECQALVKQLNLENRVHFLSACASNQAPYYYKNCDIFVLPAQFKLKDNVQMESWGFTVNEAMALEIPVVATDAVGAGFDLIIDTVTGGLAKASDVSSLSAKINFIISHNQNNKIGTQARKHLLKVCNYQDNYLAYKQAINKASNV